MRVIDRLVQYLTTNKISAYSFERSCQVANGYLKKQQKGKGTIGSEILERIYRNFPQINLLWLISGLGEMSQDAGPMEKNEMQEEKSYYTKEEMIQSLADRIRLLEKALVDKEKIIHLLEKGIPLLS